MYYAVLGLSITDFILVSMVLSNLFFGARAQRIPTSAKAFFIVALGAWAIWSCLVFFVTEKHWGDDILFLLAFGMMASTVTQAAVYYFHKRMGLWNDAAKSGP